jgi:hypothetical protein
MKTASVTNHQESINKNHNEVSPNSSKRGYYQQGKKVKMLAKM